MTNEEAIKLVDDRMCYGRGKWSKHHQPVIDEYWQAGEMAIKALEVEPHWIPVTENTLPEDGIPVNVTWVNRKPEFYYSEIKDKPYTATAIYFRGKWFWYSCVIEDWLAEYGSNESFLANLQEAVDGDIEITAWMPLPEPFKGVTE